MPRLKFSEKSCFTYKWILEVHKWQTFKWQESPEFLVNPNSLIGWDTSIRDIKWRIVLRPSEIRDNHVFFSLQTVGERSYDFELDFLLSLNANQFGHLKSTKLLKFPLAMKSEQLQVDYDTFVCDSAGNGHGCLSLYCRMWPRERFSSPRAGILGETNGLSTDKHDEAKPTGCRNALRDLTYLYQEGILCDTKLCTTSETFPAHKVVLGARSPVFRAMFTTDMRENATDSVDIEDLDADTVRQMLLFLYTDKVTGMQWDRAKSLYFAADKYQILSLKHLCTSFLEMNLQVSNCCDILVLADKHQDKGLKKSVHDYILKHNEEVFGSEEWKSFMLKNLQLAAETMYLKVKDK